MNCKATCVALLLLSLLVAQLVSLAATAATTTISLADALNHYDLSGQWLFKVGDDTAWAAKDFDDSQWDTATIPGRWPVGGYPESNQFAWYRKTLNFDLQGPQSMEQLSRIGIELQEIPSAYRFYIGGVEMGGAGNFPPQPEADFDRRRFFHIPASTVSADGSVVLALRVWGGESAVVNHEKVGPVGRHFRMGHLQTMMARAFASQSPTVIFGCLFLVFGLYHIYLHLRNSHLDGFVWFGLMSLDVALYSFELSQGKYMLGWSPLVFEKIELFSMLMIPPLCMQMIWSLLKEPFGLALRAYQWSFVLTAVATAAIPSITLQIFAAGYWQLWALPSLGLISALLWRKLHQNSAEARTLFFGVMLFVAASLYDSISEFMQADTMRLLPLGFLAVMIAMAISLANRFTSLFSALEAEVAERTVQLRDANLHLAEVARNDPLTGILNRRGFLADAEIEIGRASRSGSPVCLVIGDIDHFKPINDRYGHACGDAVLVQLAAKLRERVRDIDRIARWGGEEFIFLLPETDGEGAMALAENLRDVVARSQFEFDSTCIELTMTFGVALYRREELLESTIARADTALYDGKKQGRNKVTLSSRKDLTLVR